MIKKYIRFLKSLRDQNEEIIYANVWRDTLRGVDWADKIPSISPGRYAVGYNYLYVITRILIDMRPQNVLDVGLGISSTLLSTYFREEKIHGEHIILEHDRGWADFYTSSHELSPSSKIVFQEIEQHFICNENYDGYNGDILRKTLKGKRFSIVSIDAPKAKPKAKYARRDLIDYIPEILNDSFVILVDDANRVSEKNTINAIEKKLEDAGIKYYEKIYFGVTHLCVIASGDNIHFCSL